MMEEFELLSVRLWLRSWDRGPDDSCMGVFVLAGNPSYVQHTVQSILAICILVSVLAPAIWWLTCMLPPAEARGVGLDRAWNDLLPLRLSMKGLRPPVSPAKAGVQGSLTSSGPMGKRVPVVVGDWAAERPLRTPVRDGWSEIRHQQQPGAQCSEWCAGGALTHHTLSNSCCFTSKSSRSESSSIYWEGCRYFAHDKIPISVCVQKEGKEGRGGG
jgi:hypothetical protein